MGKKPEWKKKELKNERVNSIFNSSAMSEFTDGASQVVYEYVVFLESKLEEKANDKISD